MQLDFISASLLMNRTSGVLMTPRSAWLTVTYSLNIPEPRKESLQVSDHSPHMRLDTSPRTRTGSIRYMGASLAQTIHTAIRRIP
jgi:hypothetical protein